MQRIGYLPVFSGIAFNSGCAGSYERRIIDAVRHARQSTGRPIAVVGHSRGGHYAKSIAAARPGDISHVVCLGSGLDACERYFPALQFVVWAGKPAREAMESAMFETAGEA